MSLKDMKNELKELRKTSAIKPISKMKKTDIALELEKLRGVRESTPAVDATNANSKKRMEPKIVDIKVAKEQSFPMAPSSSLPKKNKKESAGVAVGGGEPKMSKKDMLKKLIEEMSDE